MTERNNRLPYVHHCTDAELWKIAFIGNHLYPRQVPIFTSAFKASRFIDQGMDNQLFAKIIKNIIGLDNSDDAKIYQRKTIKKVQWALLPIKLHPDLFTAIGLKSCIELDNILAGRLNQTAKPSQKEIVKFFTANELWKIMLKLGINRKSTRYSYLALETIKSTIENGNFTHELYLTLGDIIGLTEDDKCPEAFYHAIIQELPTIRTKLSSLSIKQIQGDNPFPWLTPDCPPPIPRKFVLSHPKAGNVIVSKHAWEQFCERYLRVMNKPRQYDNYSQSTLVQKMRELFQNVQEEEMTPAYRIKRLGRNDFVEAKYFIEIHHNLRFVVRIKDSTLATVEIAVRRSF